LVEAARAHGVALGLWFAPDSTNDYALFEQDAEVILKFYRTLGVRHFKIDGVRTVSALGEDRLRSFFERVAQGSNDQVIFDLDITAGLRPGYFGLLPVERLFVENRYTDWHGYWPHQTLRNFWKLTRWIDPRRLRMEFLNATRNPDKYPDDPLAPSKYPVETLFASVMLGAPLAWLEVSHLPGELIDRLSPLIALWREHRAELSSGDILTLGEAPDGWTWTGFASVDHEDRHIHVLVFRECHDSATVSWKLPTSPELQWKVHPISGKGSARMAENQSLAVEIPEQRDFVWVHLERNGFRVRSLYFTLG
jgi:alpha-galactosidase